MYAAVWVVKGEVWNLETFMEFPHVLVLCAVIAVILSEKRLRWSKGSVLPLGTQVRGFKPGRSREDVSGRKNPQHAFLRRGSKAVGPMS
jgi:hypothetical protein